MTKPHPAARKVVLTGLSSFSGSVIARTLSAQGFQVWGLQARAEFAPRTELEQKRIRESLVDKVIYEAPFGSQNFLDTLQVLAPDVIISHGAPIKGYRSADFALQKCVEDSTFQIKRVVAALSPTARFIHSGSLFEADTERKLSAFSPYGLAKTLTWNEILTAFAGREHQLTKIVIPDPIGPGENLDRLGPLFFKQWAQGEKTKLVNPQLEQDRIPATMLANFYVEEAHRLADSLVIRRPSGFKTSLLTWAERLQSLFENTHAAACPGFAVSGDEAGRRWNTEEAPQIADPQQSAEFFKDYGQWLARLSKT